jgi:hypothetical protein
MGKRQGWFINIPNYMRMVQSFLDIWFVTSYVFTEWTMSPLNSYKF